MKQQFSNFRYFIKLRSVSGCVVKFFSCWLEWIVLFLLVCLPIFVAVNGKRKKFAGSFNRLRFYFKEIVVSLLLLAAFFVLQPTLYKPLDFARFNTGVPVSLEVISVIVPLFFIPLF